MRIDRAWRDAVAEVVQKNLFKSTWMQDTFSIKQPGLVKRQPTVLNLKELCYYYIEHCQ